MKQLIIIFFTVLSTWAAAPAKDIQYTVEKAPYARFLESGKLTVVASFDGCKETDKWRDILDFAKQNNVRFTFFVSGVYFLSDKNRNAYIYPADPSKRGISSIGFGGASSDVVKRTQLVLEALKDGHDVESHLNGHFNAKSWNGTAWREEFSQFNAITNFLPRPTAHVRFPLLAMNDNVFPVMAEFGIRSITSVVENDFKDFSRVTVAFKGRPFTLLEFPIPVEKENASRLLMMDYNFYYYDEKHKVEARKAGEEMEKLYLEEAERCFRENRPLFLSHHFAGWNHDVYWAAMKKVILTLKKKYPSQFLTVSELCDKLTAK